MELLRENGIDWDCSDWVSDPLEISDIYQSFRIRRRPLDTRSIEIYLSEKDTDLVNRWNQAESVKGGQRNQLMKEDYAQI